MNRYQPSIPRVTLGIAALAMTALSVALVVVIPAKFGAGDQMLAASKIVSPAATAVVIAPARINVVGVRDRELVSAQVRVVDPKCRQQEI